MVIALAVAVAKLAPGTFAPGHFNKMLNQLPNETIGKLVANLLHVDLKRLSLVSYRIRAITLPFLFRSLVFSVLRDTVARKLSFASKVLQPAILSSPWCTE